MRFLQPQGLCQVQRNAQPRTVEPSFGRDTGQKGRLAAGAGSSSNKPLPGCSLSSRRESCGQQLAEEQWAGGKARTKDTLKQGIRQYNKNNSHCSQEKEETYSGVNSLCRGHGWTCSSRSSGSSWISCKDIAEMDSPKAVLKLDGNLLLNLFFLLFSEYFCIKCLSQKYITWVRKWLFSLGFIFVFTCLWSQASLIPCSQLLGNTAYVAAHESVRYKAIL